MSFQYPELETKHSEIHPTQRVPVDLSGRCMLPSQAEHQCRTTEMSPDDMVVVARARVEKGDKIVVYLETLGRFAGVVSRQTSTGFELALQLPPMKREKLVSQLEWFANRDALALPEKRRCERIVPLTQLSVMRLHTGREHIVKINDISRDGANIETDFQPPVGMEVIVGSTPGVVVRHFDGGVACQFTTPFDVEALDKTMKL